MPSVKDILIEMKDMSELMVDLAYSAVLFNNKDAAEEVLTLENRLNSNMSSSLLHCCSYQVVFQ